MSDHPWLRSLNVPVVCPKCDTPALRRSHTKSRIERFFKKYTLKRKYRCHECGWSGWLDEAHLRYPASTSAVPSFSREIVDDEIHDVSLSSPQSESGTSRDVKPAETVPSARSGSPETTGPVEYFEPPSFTGSDSQQTSDVVPAEEARAKRLEIPEFEHPGETRPFSIPVEENYHVHSGGSGLGCPKCRANALFRSHHRSWHEGLRKTFSSKRPYRCRKCGWRGWLVKQF